MKKPIVKELWMLWNPKTGDFVPAFDDPDPYIAYLCTTTKKAATALQKHQKELYEVISVPIRII